MKKEIRQGYVALGIVSVFWGTSYVASKIGSTYMPPVFLAGIRQFLTGSIISTFFLLKRQPLPTRNSFKKIFFQAILLLFLGNGLITWSLKFINSGLAAIISALVPLFVALFSILIRKPWKISRWMLLGLMMGLAGVCIIFYDYLGQIRNQPFMTGIAMALASVVAWSFGSVYSSRQQLPVSILFSVGLQMFMSGSILVVICLASGKYVNLMHSPVEGWYALLYLIVVGSLLSYSAYVFALSKLPPTLVSVYAYINPVVAIFLGWLLLKEKMNEHLLPGSLFILYGVYLVNRESNKQKIMGPGKKTFGKTVVYDR
ncbi:MAG: EamA family transporter [Ginsengibacter sp.]